jgi:hypothetical protein
VTFLTYEIYPWTFSGEVVELMLGCGMLVAGLVTLDGLGTRRGTAGAAARRIAMFAGAVAGLVALGTATAWGFRALRSSDPAALEAARAEVEALRQDFLTVAQRNGGRLPGCGLSRRIYTHVEDVDESALRDGAFARLTAQGMPETRAAFFIDPWNQPYWIRDRCGADESVRSVFVYSFGPNRRRDSSTRDILGDDIGAWIHRSDIGDPAGADAFDEGLIEEAAAP